LIVYKYLSSNHLNNFRQRGSIHINTLHNLRSEYEKIKDEFEGRHQLTFKCKGRETTFPLHQFSKIMPSIKANPENQHAEIVLEKGATFVSNRETSDAFVFCTSLNRSDQIKSKFGYQAYYKILNVEKFAETLFWEISQRQELICYKTGKVAYKAKDILFTERKRQDFLNYEKDDFWKICFSKPEQYSLEKEFRIVFCPQFWRTDLQPIDLDCPRLLDYCSF
jgi:hypothetical protein